MEIPDPVYAECPICKLGHDSRSPFPRMVCSRCCELAVDQTGRRVRFANQDSMGGVSAFYEDNHEPYSSRYCLIEGVICEAIESHTMGVFLQAARPHPKLELRLYGEMNSRQQENYNIQKLSGVLADFGYLTHRLTDDWNGADLIAQHVDGDEFLKIQVKGRLTFAKKYQSKEIWIAFRNGLDWYLYPHDEVLDVALELTNIANTDSWRTAGGYSFPGIPEDLRETLAEYRVPRLG